MDCATAPLLVLPETLTSTLAQYNVLVTFWKLQTCRSERRIEGVAEVSLRFKAAFLVKL